MIRYVQFIVFACLVGCATNQSPRSIFLEVFSKNKVSISEIDFHKKGSKAVMCKKNISLSEALDWLNSECPASSFIQIDMQKPVVLAWPESRDEIGPLVISRLQSRLIPQIVVSWVASSYDAPIFTIEQQTGRLLLQSRENRDSH